MRLGSKRSFPLTPLLFYWIGGVLSDCERPAGSSSTDAQVSQVLALSRAVASHCERDAPRSQKRNR
jgi:hypothetical protein